MSILTAAMASACIREYRLGHESMHKYGPGREQLQHWDDPRHCPTQWQALVVIPSDMQ